MIALLFFDWLVQKPPSWIATAQTKPILDNLGEKLMAALPEDFEASVMKRFRNQEGGAGGETAAPSETGEPPPADTEENPDNEAAPDESGTDDQGATLDPKQQRNIDQLIENSGSAD